MNNWIRNKDHQPTSFMQILIAHGNKYVDCGFRDDKGLWQIFSGEIGKIGQTYQIKCESILDCHVQYWMPIPNLNNSTNNLSANILEEFQKKLDKHFSRKEFTDE